MVKTVIQVSCNPLTILFWVACVGVGYRILLRMGTIKDNFSPIFLKPIFFLLTHSLCNVNNFFK
ncbi:hypothetical protein TSH100_06560 [Azospirillum sp. TSH100]|nr:hypothetical protein TSH100_06560 [Azospirillum sp. TSH100]